MGTNGKYPGSSQDGAIRSATVLSYSLVAPILQLAFENTPTSEIPLAVDLSGIGVGCLDCWFLNNTAADPGQGWKICSHLANPFPLLSLDFKRIRRHKPFLNSSRYFAV
jgi:hypothetical protein